MIRYQNKDLSLSYLFLFSHIFFSRLFSFFLQVILEKKRYYYFKRKEEREKKMNKQKTVREGSNRIVELDEDRERRNV